MKKNFQILAVVIFSTEFAFHSRRKMRWEWEESTWSPWMFNLVPSANNLPIFWNTSEGLPSCISPVYLMELVDAYSTARAIFVEKGLSFEV